MGSIITPSTQNNLVGIKPTLGLCSRELIIPITIRQDTVGPMAKTVKDAAIILTAMAGKDPLDNYTMVQPFEEIPDYTKALNLAALKGARIGIPRNSVLPYSTDDIAQMAAFEDAIQIMRTAGAIIVDNANFTAYKGDLWDNMDIIMESSGKVFISDFIVGIAEYLSKVTKPGSPIQSLQDLADCTMSDPREDYPQRDIADWDDALASNVTNDSEEIWQAYQRDLYFGREGGVVGALDRYNLDALILPSLSASVIPALGGLPIVTVPVGKQPDDTEVFSQPPYNLVLRGPNMPFGISFLGRQWSEETLIGLAYAFEQRTMIRKTVVPVIKPKTELKLQSRL
jgi:amidase